MEDIELELVDVFVLILRRGGAISRPLTGGVGSELGSDAVGLGL